MPHAAKYQTQKPNFRRKKCCTDIPCCILFALFIICFVILSIFAFKEGDPRQLIHPTDDQGNLCGTGDYKDRPYLYFFDWTKCIKSLNIPANLVKGRPFVCPTPQVCVAKCPELTSYYKFGNYPPNRICTYEAQTSEIPVGQLVEQGKCAPYIIASKPLFGRCVPEQLQSLANLIIEASDGSGNNGTIFDSDGRPLNGTKLGDGVKYIVDVLNLKQIGAFLLEDFTASWKYILIGLVFAALTSFLWILLMRWFVKPIIWLGLILFFVLLILITVLSFNEFIQLRAKNGNQIITEFKFVADTNYYRSLPITWLVIGIICIVFLLVALLILIVIIKRLRIALEVLREASIAVGYNIFSLFWPVIPFLLQIGVFVYWIIVALYLSTAGKPIYRISSNETIDINSGDLCDPQKWNKSAYTNADCVFWQYGYDPGVDLDSVLNGTGHHFKSFITFVNKNQWLPQLFSAFMLFWLTAFVIGFNQLVLAGVFARYYWDKQRFSVPCVALMQSVFRALFIHTGTIAFGSLIIAIVKIIRGMLEYVEKKVKEKTGNVARCVFCCCRCCLFCLEKFLKFLNRNAYIMTAIYGTGFFTSARRAFKIIISNPLNLLVIDKVTDFLIFLGKLCITAAIGILAFFFFTSRISHANDFVPELHYYFIPLAFIIVGTYAISTVFFSVYSMAVDTLFLCALEDLQMRKDDPSHQISMSKGLQRILIGKNKK